MHSKRLILSIGVTVGVGALAFWSLQPGNRSGRPLATTSATAAQSLSFNQVIQPILSDNCYQCHGPDSLARKGKLRLDRAEYAFAPRKDGPVIVPGKPDRSPFITRIETANPKEVMPPPESHKTLTAEQVALLRRWVAEGAVYEEHWAFLNPKPPPAPAPKQAGWAVNDIDRFVLARLEKEGLQPSGAAEKARLLRRVTFDLTGLPPTADELGAFLSDASAGAYERVVDRLLASPRYGEHRARYWLDAARLADTHGLHYDNYRVSWPYRDYVIRAFNENKPFDQFALEQIAGDLLPAETIDQLVATGFNRAHVTSNENGAILEELQQNIVADRVATVATVFLGLTAGCAACHDHKFDPISQKEFYQLSAFFNNSRDFPFDGNIDAPDPVVKVPSPEKIPAANAVLKELAAVKRDLRARRALAGELLPAWIAAGAVDRLTAGRVSPEGLALHLRFDEGRGDRVRNSAPGAEPADLALEGGGQVWGGEVKFWPALRFDIKTSLRAPGIGDFDRADAFTFAGWFKPREVSVSRSGSLVSKMDAGTGRGWELSLDQSTTKDGGARREMLGRVIVRLVDSKKTSEIQVRGRDVVGRRDWTHIAFSYDGSGKAAGVRIYLNGRSLDVEILQDTLAGSFRAAAPLQIGKREEGAALAETSYQDLRLYGRALRSPEIRVLGQEEIVAEVLARPASEWSVDQQKVVRDYYFQRVDAPSVALLAQQAELEAKFAALTADGVKTLITQERDDLPIAHVLDRGVYSELRERVAPGVPHAFPPLPPTAPANRLGLAQWIVSPQNPLTARVTVNRMWQELFGTGLVETPQDFGLVGARPSHPELLDWLAVDFRDHGWDLKRFYRQVVLSATYRQSAKASPALLEKDPHNRLLARGPRFRLDAEMIRDAALAASGLLVEQVGGPSVKTYQPPGIWEAVAYLGSDTKTHHPDKGDALYRRSVYSFWKRTSPPPLLATFDAPPRDVCIVRRERTNTPLQALAVMNSPDFLEAARRLAERALKESDTNTEQKINFMARALLSRPLASPQVRALSDSLAVFQRRFSDPTVAQGVLAMGDSARDASLPVPEHAAWTMVASQLLNTDEALNK